MVRKLPENSDWYKNTVVYAVDVARFYDASGDGVGDLRGLTAKLDYLTDLGIGCIWLLPFYPSPRRDNGYDVADYMNVDTQLGTLDDFRVFMRAAKAKGLRVIIDLVIHHSSDKHPWFLAATNEVSPRYRDYYLWASHLTPEIQDKNSFPTVEKGVWHYEKNIRAYYRHQFYRFEPDLNLANPAVEKEIYAIIDFWLSFGVDGFRFDAATHMLRNKGLATNGTEPKDFFEKMRTFIADRNPTAILIAEADVDITDLPDFIGHDDRFHLLYNFLLNGAVFASLATQNIGETVRILHQETAIRHHGTLLNFIRNADELNLERLSKMNREYVMKLFAPDPHVQIFQRGIRRRLPPMLNNDQAWIRMTYCLLFALPGPALLLYGEELGMGDNPNLKGRNSVRIPMQWDNSKNGGFSKAASSHLVAPLKTDSTYGYKVINVAAQQHDPDSLYAFIRKLIGVRKQQRVFADGLFEVTDLLNSALLGLSYTGRHHTVFIVINFSHESQTITLPHALVKHYTVLIGEDIVKQKNISGFGYSWLELKNR